MDKLTTGLLLSAAAAALLISSSSTTIPDDPELPIDPEDPIPDEDPIPEEEDPFVEDGYTVIATINAWDATDEMFRVSSQYLSSDLEFPYIDTRGSSVLLRTRATLTEFITRSLGRFTGIIGYRYTTRFEEGDTAHSFQQTLNLNTVGDLSEMSNGLVSDVVLADEWSEHFVTLYSAGYPETFVTVEKPKYFHEWGVLNNSAATALAYQKVDPIWTSALVKNGKAFDGISLELQISTDRGMLIAFDSDAHDLLVGGFVKVVKHTVITESQTVAEVVVDAKIPSAIEESSQIREMYKDIWLIDFDQFAARTGFISVFIDVVGAETAGIHIPKLRTMSILDRSPLWLPIDDSGAIFREQYSDLNYS